MKLLKFLLPIFFLFIGCSEKQNSLNVPVVNDGALVINPPVTVKDADKYQVESAYIGMTDLANNGIQGIIKVKYKGSADLRDVNADFTFINKDNIALFKYTDYISNVTDCYCNESNDNDWSFFTSKYNTGYIFISGKLTDFGLTALEDISKIDLSITAVPFTYAPPKGQLSKTGYPYKDKDNHWCINTINDGDRKIVTYMENIKFLYLDSKSRLYRWTIPDNYPINSFGEWYSYYFDIGETVFLSSNNSYSNDLKESFTCVEVCLQWSY